jgi:hypothetical protein
MIAQKIVVILLIVSSIGCIVAQTARLKINMVLKQRYPDMWRSIFRPSSLPGTIEWFKPKVLWFSFQSNRIDESDRMVHKLKVFYRVGAIIWWLPLLALATWAAKPLIMR